jgi:HSP20 family protein
MLPSTFRDEDRNPFLSSHREINRLFDDVSRTFDRRLPTSGAISLFGVGWPNVEVSETDTVIKVTVEIPGLEEKDVEVLLQDGVLTLKGDKRSEKSDSERQFSERLYGRFERRISLATEVQEDRIEARFRNGVLSVTLPKSDKAQSQIKRFAIKA